MALHVFKAISMFFIGIFGFSVVQASWPAISYRTIFRCPRKAYQEEFHDLEC